MKVYDETLTTELTDYDLTKGKLETAQRVCAHHAAQERVWHYEVMEGTVTDSNPNGLRRIVTDTPASDAYDEYETVQRYVPYTDEELAAITAKEAAQKAAKEAAAAAQKAAEEAAQKAAEEAEAAAKAEAERLDRLEAQSTYTAMMTDTLLAEEEETNV